MQYFPKKKYPTVILKIKQMILIAISKQHIKYS